MDILESATDFAVDVAEHRSAAHHFSDDSKIPEYGVYGGLLPVAVALYDVGGVWLAPCSREIGQAVYAKLGGFGHDDHALRPLEQPCLRASVWSADGTAAAISFASLANAREGEYEVHICMDISRLSLGKYRLEILLMGADNNGWIVKHDALRKVVAFLKL